MSEKTKLILLDTAAVMTAAAFIWFTLIMAVEPLHSIPAACCGHPAHSQTYGQPQPNGFWTIKIADILTLIILAVQGAIFCVQAYLSHGQRELMRGQLKATETAANAALASLNRPWLFVRDLVHNQGAWAQGEAPLIAEFRIANYGNAPAFIKSLKVAHFRGPHTHNGYPVRPMPANFRNFPDMKELEAFIASNGRTVGREVRTPESVEPIGMRVGDRRFLTVGEELSLPIAPQSHTDVLCAYGYTQVQTSAGAINAVSLTESYVIGRMFYEIPGQDAEVITFCYKSNSLGSFDLYRDYPPYNSRESARR